MCPWFNSWRHHRKQLAWEFIPRLFFCTKFCQMILYNVTVKIDKDVHADWLQWMKDIHIPDVLSTGMFVDNKLCRVMIDEADGFTYSIQYFCKNMEILEKYNKEYAPRLQKEHQDRYAGKFVAFRTLMDVI